MGERVFQIGELNFNLFFITNIIKILDKGSKFVPCLHFNHYHIFKNLLNNFDNYIPYFNQFVFFKKKSFERSLLYNNSLNSLSTISTVNSNLNSEFNVNLISSSSSETSSDSPLCTSLDCFFEKVKKPLDPFNKLLENESIDFKFNFYKHMTNFNFSYSQNLNYDLLECLYTFIKDRPFFVAECDKNVGLTILEHDIYENFCFSLLNDSNTYSVIEHDPLESINVSLRTIINELVSSKNLDKKLANRLFRDKPSLGNFRILFKLHKDKLGLRPIINSTNHPTSHISLLIDLILQPFVKRTKSFILDSQNAIQILKDKYFPHDSIITSSDFESLFTNIDLTHALNVLTDFISRNFHSTEVSTFTFHILLKFVFENNYFIFKNNFFRQKNGVAMGAICSPSVTNLFMSILEEKFLTIYRPLAYVRFVDDILAVFRNDFDLNIFKNFFGYLKLNVICNSTVNFLDLLIKFDPVTGKLIFSLYIKPTNTFCYLLPTSNHPNFIFKNIPKCIFFRTRRICTLLSDYYFFSRIYKKQLLLRNYNESVLNKTIRLIANLDREKIIPYSINAIKFDTTKKLFFKLPFNFNYLNVEKFFSNYFKDSNIFCDYLRNYNIKLINSISPNISRIFVHGFNIKKPSTFKFSKCEKSNCKHCRFANCNSFVKLREKFFLPILRNTNCRSINLIYILYCNCCFHYYIGQTKNFRKRLNEHKRNIRLHILDGKTNILVNHFKLQNHSLSNLNFFIFKDNIFELDDRLNQELQLIHLFLKLGVPILNEKIPNLYIHKKHSILFDR